MKYLIFFTVFLISFSSCGHSQGHGHASHGNKHGDYHSIENAEDLKNLKTGSLTNFPVVGFRKVHEEIIPYPVEKVFPLFEPQGRPLLYSKWKPTVLREGENGSLKGHTEFSMYDDLSVFLTVTKHNSEKGHIQYLVIWDDFEIQRIDIFCTKGEKDNSTKITWVEHNAGLYEKGVSLVSMFVEEGYLAKVVERYITNVEKKLEDEK